MGIGPPILCVETSCVWCCIGKHVVADRASFSSFSGAVGPSSFTRPSQLGLMLHVDFSAFSCSLTPGHVTCKTLEFTFRSTAAFKLQSIRCYMEEEFEGSSIITRVEQVFRQLCTSCDAFQHYDVRRRFDVRSLDRLPPFS